MYIRVNGDRNNWKIKLFRFIEKRITRFFRVCFWDGYKNIWFDVFK